MMPPHLRPRLTTRHLLAIWLLLWAIFAAVLGAVMQRLQPRPVWRNPLAASIRLPRLPAPYLAFPLTCTLLE